MIRVRLHNTGGGTHHLLLGKVVFSLVFLPGCQLPLYSLILMVGSLCLYLGPQMSSLGTLYFKFGYTCTLYL